jgi:hypothetical protein
MSGLDPLATQLLATLDLGLPLDALQAQIAVGDLLEAIVLPPQDGQDRVQILGQPVAAQLPPAIHPGDALVLQVTGFSRNQVLVRNLGAPDPQNAPATQQQPVAPPRAVFVAASVRASGAQPQPSTHATLPAAVRNQVQNAVHTAVQQIARQTARSVGDLLKAIRVPDTPLTRTAAAIAPQTSSRITTVLQRLDAAVPKNSSDARIATLRTILAFVSRIDPANEETLPAQIASYVSNVVEGSEPKVHRMLEQLAELPVSHSVGHAAAAQAHAAERAAAIDHDLKSLVLSLLHEPQADRSPELTRALNETLVTLTAVQVNALSNQTQTPGAIALTLPIHFHAGGRPAQIGISRDAESSSRKLDADNFHIAFVLDTAHLGTVAIDLQTVGRAVKVDVKTETAPAASHFKRTIDSLRARLETLRYRVSSATAAVLPHTMPTEQHRHGEPTEPQPSIVEAPHTGLDLRA